MGLPSFAPPQYAVLRRIKIGGEGGWDYLTASPDTHQLFVTRGSHVMVIDTQTEKVIGDLPDTPGVHGVAVDAKSNKGYASNGRNNTVTVFDLKSLKVLSQVPVGSRPDAIAFDSASNRVFTFNAGTSDSTAIDTKTDTVAGTVKLDGKPEFARTNGKGDLFVNIEDKSEIQRFDTKNLKVTATWALAPGEEPSGLAFDEKDNLLFSTCSNNLFSVSDAKTQKLVDSVKIGSGPDAAVFDQKFGLAFSSNGDDGTVTIVGKGRSNKWEEVQTLTTQRGARTMTIDQKSHLIYLITAEFGPGAPGQRRPSMLPGTAMILVVGPTN